MIEEIFNIGNRSQSDRAKSESSKTVSKDEFLKLLTYQLRAQNPLRPYDNQEFAAQLAQFSQLEQLTQIKSLLEEHININYILTKTISNTALPGLIGKNASSYTDNIRFDGDKPVEIQYQLNYPASSGELVIKDSNGNYIRTITLTNEQLAKGERTIIWDGKDSNGNKVSEGQYYISFNMKDAQGKTFTIKPQISGKIEAVRFKNEGTVIVINGTEVALGDIFNITTDEI